MLRWATVAVIAAAIVATVVVAFFVLHFYSSFDASKMQK